MRTVSPSLSRVRRPARAFTLVEVLLVLALLAMGGAVLLSSAGSIFAPERAGNPEDAIAEVLQQARREAVLTGREVVLRFESGKQRFEWEGSTVGVGSGETRMKVDFLRPVPGSAVLIGGQRVETALVSFLRFFPDGTCDPVRVQFRVGEHAPRIMAIDPWTCAPGLEVNL